VEKKRTSSATAFRFVSLFWALAFNRAFLEEAEVADLWDLPSGAGGAILPKK